jgi:ABC-type multidrug transport system fused ATPase/permease subunit
VTSIFSVIGFTLYKIMNGEAQKLGKMSSSLKIENSEKIVEAIRFYRETFVHNKTEKYIDEIESINLRYAAVSSKLNFMPYISKYVIETAVIIGSVLVSAIQFILHDLTSAVTTLSLFLAAGSRLAPAVLRVQQGFVSIRGGLGQAEPTLELINELEIPMIKKTERPTRNSFDSVFSPHIKMSKVNMKYPNSLSPALVDVNIEIESGQHVAIVGPSGSGKSTLVDVLLGILMPTSGSVEISGVPPREAISNWPGKISFVPQDVFLTKTSIRDNITIGYLPNEISSEIWQDAIKSADLESFVNSLPQKAETKVGEDGALISGGQKQRIGIARALVSNPKLLVLDESTSSLDLQSESEISQSLLKLKGEVTVIMIAHRLISIKDADVIIYLDGGRVLSVGDFEKVKMDVPEFNLMAQKSGI